MLVFVLNYHTNVPIVPMCVTEPNQMSNITGSFCTSKKQNVDTFIVTSHEEKRHSLKVSQKSVQSYKNKEEKLKQNHFQDAAYDQDLFCGKVWI